MTAWIFLRSNFCKQEKKSHLLKLDTCNKTPSPTVVYGQDQFGYNIARLCVFTESLSMRPPFDNGISIGIWRWIGHLIRMSSNSLTHFSTVLHLCTKLCKFLHLVHLATQSHGYHVWMLARARHTVCMNIESVVLSSLMFSTGCSWLPLHVNHYSVRNTLYVNITLHLALTPVYTHTTASMHPGIWPS